MDPHARQETPDKIRDGNFLNMLQYNDLKMYGAQLLDDYESFWGRL